MKRYGASSHIPLGITATKGRSTRNTLWNGGSKVDQSGNRESRKLWKLTVRLLLSGQCSKVPGDRPITRDFVGKGHRALFAIDPDRLPIPIQSRGPVSRVIVCVAVSNSIRLLPAYPPCNPATETHKSVRFKPS
jgi:hypothetical protein